MEWDDLKSGMIIRWNANFVKDFDPIIIILEHKFNEFGTIGFDTQVLNGTRYDVFEYSRLLTSYQSIMGYTKLYWRKFEKNKNDIVISKPEDLSFIKRRMERHISSYETAYRMQKSWANDLLRKAEKFYDKC